MFHECEGAVVNRYSKNRHVVSSQNTMTKTVSLPLCNKFRRPHDYLFQEIGVFVAKSFILKVSIKVVDNVVEHLGHHLVFESV